MPENGGYGISVRTSRGYDAAVAAITAALAAEGVGVLTEIDVARTMKERLGVDFRPYVIIGACNPNLAHRALSADMDLGLLLPCNVIVYDDPDSTVVAAMDPALFARVADNPALEPIAGEARDRITRALGMLPG